MHGQKYVYNGSTKTGGVCSPADLRSRPPWQAAPQDGPEQCVDGVVLICRCSLGSRAWVMKGAHAYGKITGKAATEPRQ